MADAPVRTDPLQSPLRQIDLVADRFECQWREGEPPTISAYLCEVPAEIRLRLLVELVCVDLEHRLRKDLSVTLGAYFREFPELETLSPADRANLEEYAKQRFIDLSKTVDYVAAPKPTPDCPHSIGRYRIGGQLGSGGQADVYLSFHPELLVPVVVKWQNAQEPQDIGQRDQLVQEGRALASLSPHPNLVRVYDSGFHEGRPFLVLEYVPGLTLEQHARDERLDPRCVANLVARLARGVHAAHEQGAIHQDINPRNVVLDGLGEPRLIDFGLAWFRPTWASASPSARPDGGTPQYLSPEQADPRISPISRRTDVFGLGAVLYFLLTRQPLYNGTALEEVLRQAANATYDTTALSGAGVPKRLAAICRKALASDPQSRYATAAKLAEALTAAFHRPRWPVAVVLTSLFLAAVAGGWLIGQTGRNQPVSEIKKSQPALIVRVWRPGTEYLRLDEALPVKSGDQLQARLRVPSGLHVSLFSIDGRGHLSLLQHYQPSEGPTELIYPGAEQTQKLGPPAGTEALLLCGRDGTPISLEEFQAAWDGTKAWPALDPPRRLLRILPDRVLEEGERPRGLYGPAQDHPESDVLHAQLDKLRERLRETCPLLEGLAFRHE
jgi:eukaryotic-like serine/threonine-protein kinase